MNIECNYDDEKCNTINFEYCDNEIVYKIQKDKETVRYTENMIIDLNEVGEITISGLIQGGKIIFLNGKSGVGSSCEVVWMVPVVWGCSLHIALLQSEFRLFMNLLK